MRHIAFLGTLLVLCSLCPIAAADSNQGKLTLSNHVLVAGVQREPGEYVVRWNGSGPDVQVAFLHDGDERVSVPGTLLPKRSGPESITTHLHEDGTRVLSQVTFSRVTLVLPHSEMSP